MQGCRRGQHERIHDAPDRIGIRITGVQQSKDKAARRTCEKQADANMPPQSG